MASELECDWYSGRTVYFQIRNSVGQIYNTAVLGFQAYQTANIANYDIPATEQGTASGFYTANMPALSAGMYSVIGKERSGGSPAETDTTIAVGDIQWSGTEISSLDNLTVDLNSAQMWDGFYAVGSTGNVCQSILTINTGGANISNSSINTLTTEILSSGDIDGFSLEETLKLCLSALAAKLSGAGTTTIVIRATDDSKPRITAEVDEFGNRTTVTLDAAG